MKRIIPTGKYVLINGQPAILKYLPSALDAVNQLTGSTYLMKKLILQSTALQVPKT